MSSRSGTGLARHACLALLASSCLLLACGDPAPGGRAGAVTTHGLCDETPPPGAALAPELPRYSGTCPALVPGVNTIRSGARDRRFILAVPAGLDPSERLPVIVLWHWLGGSANSFYTRGDVQAAVDQQRFLAILPESRGDLFFEWPFNVADVPWRMDEELRFFDDMLACAAAQHNVNKECVSSAGVSAGALFIGQLVGHRSQRLSSAISLSGGVGGLVRPLRPPQHKLPMIVLWGGLLDIVPPIFFDNTSRQLEQSLDGGGHFLLECVHNCGHAEPPIDPPMGQSRYASLWQFAFDHPYWLANGASPYQLSGVPAEYPPWCAIGPGSATPRTGACP
jgi:predicted esterase